MSKKPHRTQAQWHQLIREQESSDLSIHVFCKQKGISPASFFNWRKRINNDADRKESAPFVSLPITKNPTAQTLAEQPRTEFTLVTPQGAALQWSGTPPVAYIHSLIEV